MTLREPVRAIDLIGKVREVDLSLLAYSVTSNLGSGSFATVYAGTYKGENVAVKKLHQRQLTDKEEAKLLREIVISQDIGHRNVIKLFGCFWREKIIVMERAWCSLFDCLHKEDHPRKEDGAKSGFDGRSSRGIVLNGEDELRIAMDIAEGLKYVHGQGIIHRDLSSKNVLLGRNTDGALVAKITDFGLSVNNALLSRNLGPLTTTGCRNEEVIGTYCYCSPELFLRNQEEEIPYSTASDMFSYGVLVNELFTKKAPFENINSFIIIGYLMQDVRPKLYIPKDATEWMLMEIVGDHASGCLASSPSGRPTAADVVDRIFIFIEKEAQRHVKVHSFYVPRVSLMEMKTLQFDKLLAQKTDGKVFLDILAIHIFSNKTRYEIEAQVNDVLQSYYKTLLLLKEKGWRPHSPVMDDEKIWPMSDVDFVDSSVNVVAFLLEIQLSLCGAVLSHNMAHSVSSGMQCSDKHIGTVLPMHNASFLRKFPRTLDVLRECIATGNSELDSLIRDIYDGKYDFPSSSIYRELTTRYHSVVVDLMQFLWIRSNVIESYSGELVWCLRKCINSVARAFPDLTEVAHAALREDFTNLLSTMNFEDIQLRNIEIAQFYELIDVRDWVDTSRHDKQTLLLSSIVLVNGLISLMTSQLFSGDYFADFDILKEQGTFVIRSRQPISDNAEMVECNEGLYAFIKLSRFPTNVWDQDALRFVKLQRLFGHRHFVQSYATAVEHEKYFVMELGVFSLYQYLFKMTEAERNDEFHRIDKPGVLLDVLKGLIFLHQFNIPHGALQPSNIVFVRDAVIGNLKLKIANNPDSKFYSSYIAPEQLHVWEERYDERTTKSDMYSFGVLMNEVLSGKPIWGDMKMESIIKAVLNGELPSLHNPNPDDAFELVAMDLVQQCLRRNPSERPTPKTCFDRLSASLDQMTEAEFRLLTDAYSRSLGNGDTVLHHAVKQGRLDYVRKFLESCSDRCNHQNEFGQTALHVAALLGNLEIFSVLWACPVVNRTIVDEMNQSAFVCAAADGRLDIITFAIGDVDEVEIEKARRSAVRAQKSEISTFLSRHRVA